MSLDELALLGRARQGDVAAFEQLVLTYQKRVFNLAFRLTGSREDAADLAQEALVRVYKSLGRFREQARFSTWLYRIVVNVCLDHQRSRKRQPTVSLDAPLEGNDGEVPRQVASSAADPQEAAERRDLRDAVQAAIGRLSGEHRAVLIMRDIQDMPYDEIGEILRLPLGTVKSRLNRARQALKQELLQMELSHTGAVYAGSRGLPAKGEAP